jgi:hypothetical protein
MVAATGFDYSWGRPNLVQLRQSGTFVCRYLSYDAGKNLSKAEADQLKAAGLTIVCNWETTSDRADTGGYAGGIADATAALGQARACGMPDDRPIYFSVDEDTTVGPNITAYFQGVASVLGLERTGAYGSYKVIRGLLDAGLITWAWQTYAWSYGLWDNRAHIRQVQNGIKVGGADADLNQAHADDFGQWPITQDGKLTVAEIDDLKKYIDGTRDGMLQLLGARLTQLENEIKFLTTATGQRFDELKKELGK